MELKANELRIGNYLYTNKLVVKPYSKDGLYNIMKNIEDGTDNIKPIPLTEEWLLKFGFKQEENPFWFCNNVISISPSTGTYVLYGKSGREITRTGLKYLHQLQNLYFALTNKELEIKM